MTHPPQASPERTTAPSLRRAAWLWLLALTILLFALWLVLLDLSGANRPHELHRAPWVAALTFLNLSPCLAAFLDLRRFARERQGKRAGGLGFFALSAALACVTALDCLVLLAAASSVPAVLQG